MVPGRARARLHRSSFGWRFNGNPILLFIVISLIFRIVLDDANHKHFGRVRIRKVAASLKLGNYNDFFDAKTACTNPEGMMNENSGTAAIRNGTVGVVLSDCMACSGCATSGETVFSRTFNVDKIKERINSSDTKRVLFSLAPQSLTSLALAFDDTIQDAFGRILHILKSYGAEDVIPTQTLAQPAALLQAADEFVDRYRAAATFNGTEGMMTGQQQLQQSNSSLPVLCGECPGWVTFVTRKGSERLLRCLSKVNSIMGVAGEIIARDSIRSGDDAKAAATSSLEPPPHPPPRQLLHVHVAPCYDKRVEAYQISAAARRSDGEGDDADDPPELSSSGTGKSASYNGMVDLVLSTEELKLLLDSYLAQKNCTFAEIVPSSSSSSPPPPPPPLECESMLHRPPDSGVSGGYAYNVMRIAAKKLFELDVQALTFTRGRHNIWEATISSGKQAVLRCALVYGFKSVQILTQNILRGSCKYHYVEVMSCPSGCTNGGGQIKASSEDLPQTMTVQPFRSGSLKKQRELVHKQQVEYYKLPVKYPEDARIGDEIRGYKKSAYTASATEVYHQVGAQAADENNSFSSKEKNMSLPITTSNTPLSRRLPPSVRRPKISSKRHTSLNFDW